VDAHGEVVGFQGLQAAKGLRREEVVVLGSSNDVIALADRVEAILATWELPVRCPPFDTDAIWEAMAHDKKRQGRSLRWVLPHAIGDVKITEDVSPDAVKSVLYSLGARSEK